MTWRVGVHAPLSPARGIASSTKPRVQRRGALTSREENACTKSVFSTNPWRVARHSPSPPVQCGPDGRPPSSPSWRRSPRDHYCHRKVICGRRRRCPWRWLRRRRRRFWRRRGGPELLPSGTSAGVADEGLGIGNCTGRAADCGNASSARTASGVKSGIPLERRAAISDGVPGNVGGGGRRDLADGDVVDGGCGVADWGGARAVALSMEAAAAVGIDPLANAVPSAQPGRVQPRRWRYGRRRLRR